MATDTLPPPAGVHGPLARLRRAVVRYVVWEALARIALGAAVFAWLALLCDYALFRLTGFDWVDAAPRWLRAAVPITCGGGLAVVLWRVVRRLGRRITDPALALAVERRFPNVLQDRVITAVELTDVATQARAGYSAAMLNQTLADAAERLARVDVERVLDWKRLRSRWVSAGLLAVVPAVIVAAAMLLRGVPLSPVRSLLVVGQLAERNLLLRNQSWPRAAHLRLLVPAGGLRIGRDAPAPKLTAVASEWVMADPAEPGGWRPMLGADLGKFFSGLPPADAAVEVDRLFERPEYAVLRDDLAGVVTNPWLARRLRRLDRPEDVSITYAGLPANGRPSATTGRVRMARQADGTLTAELAGLKESVRLRAEAADFRTPPAEVILIPPPQLLRLARAEWRPAYLFHAADDPAGLKGLQQRVAERELGVTGDRTVFTVPAGTAVELSGTADKPLAAVRLGRKGGEAVTHPAAGADFRLPLGPGRLAAGTEFELTLIDPDGVTTARPVLVQVTDDQPPQVEFAFDSIRKVGGNHLVTAACRAPLGKDGVVRDDFGLSTLRWRFTAARQESAAATALATQLTALAGAAAAGTLARGPVVAGELPVPAFERLADAVPRNTLAAVRRTLLTPADPSAPVPAVREVRFNPDLDAFDLLDASAAVERKAGPLRVSDPAGVQPRYLIEVQLTAADTDADGGPKSASQVELVRLLVVSEADLLAEITKDEDQQTAKLDEAIRRVREAELKLAQQAERLAPANPPAELRLTARVRADDILQDVGKARDLVRGVTAEYARLRREVEANRVGPEPDESGRPVSKVAKRYDAVVLKPLDAILAGEFVAADDALGVVRADLAADRRPADAAVADARSRLAALGLKLAGVRAALGESLSESRLRDELTRLIDRQKEVSAALSGLKDRMVKSLFAPKVSGVRPVEVARGQTAVVKHLIDWNVYDQGELTVRFEWPSAGPSGPALVAVKDDKLELEYTLTAGDVAGEFSVRLVPSVGEPVTVMVVVR